MANKLVKYTVFPATGLLVAYLLMIGWYEWLYVEAPSNQSLAYDGQKIVHIDQVGTRSLKGNLLGIQPWMTPADYRDKPSFEHKLNTYLQTARDSGLIIPHKTIVILPGYLGTWLVAMHESNRVYQAKTIEAGLMTMVLTRPIEFARAYRNVPEGTKDKTKHALFTMKGQEMADAYVKTFNHLAALYKVTIVAGSILLPNPRVVNQRIQVDKGPVYSISALFHPNGRLDSQLVKKAFPNIEERPLVYAANPNDLPVFDTSVGRLGVLVCADSWNSAAYKILKKKRATLLAVPAYSVGDSAWQTPWQQYNGATTLTEAHDNVDKLTEGDVWLTHAMASHAMSEAGITKGLNVFLRGKFWNLGTDGTTIILNNQTKADSAGLQPSTANSANKNQGRLAQRVDGASLTCLWL